jgi:secernin
VCDTLCIVSRAGTLFGKNSDRPPREAQVVQPYAARPAGATLRTQYLDLPDRGAAAVLLSRPAWLWGAEHGINEHRVAIGNEKVWTVDDAKGAPPALLGMDLVRLALERSRTADEALEQLTTLLEAHGQGGSGEQEHDEPYFSSFLISDPHGGWIVETSQRTWAAKPVGPGVAISNRISLATDWTRASADVCAGQSFQDWRDPKAPTGIADGRLAATDACVAQGFASRNAVGPREMVATLRHHGTVAWGAPGRDDEMCEPVPGDVDAEWNGITVCMHLRDYQATTASMVAELPADTEEPMRAWVALGSPCVSIYIPVFPPALAPSELAAPECWVRFAALRDRVEADPGALAPTRAALAGVEADLWDAADDAYATGSEARLERAVTNAWAPVDAALHRLGV